MENFDSEVKSLRWGYQVFQRCIPKEHRVDTDILLGRYYSRHPRPEVIRRIIDLHKSWDSLGPEKPSFEDWCIGELK